MRPTQPLRASGAPDYRIGTYVSPIGGRPDALAAAAFPAGSDELPGRIGGREDGLTAWANMYTATWAAGAPLVSEACRLLAIRCGFGASASGYPRLCARARM